MNALLLIKDIADMILESGKDDVQLIFEDKGGNLITTTWGMDWGEDDTIIVRLPECLKKIDCYRKPEVVSGEMG